MRKQTKLVAVLSAAALLALGASMTSFAAGWEKDEAGIWHFYDEDDELVTGEWKRDGGKWFYLDDDGDMLTDSWVDGEYYVDENGAMLVNAWKKLIPDDNSEDPEGYGEYWYYFGSKGKMTGAGEETQKKINGKTYYFDETGKMRTGWWSPNGEDVYYLGDEDEGWRAGGWLWLDAPEDEDNVDGHSEAEDDKCDDEGWYWFSTSNGKMARGESRKKINGKYYYFNDHGQMLYEWINDSVATQPEADKATVDSIADMRYANEVEEGWEAGKWYLIDGNDGVGTSDDTDWYYFKDGKAKTADPVKNAVVYGTEEDAETVAVRAKIKIDGKYFCFNEKGQMQTGLQKIGDAFYYFDENGYMQTGKVSNVEEDDDNVYTYYFNTTNGKNGQGYTGEKSGYLYWNGKRLEADDEYRLYEVNDKVYIVNAKGKIQKTVAKTYYLENEGIEDDVKCGKKAGTATDGTKTYAIKFASDGAIAVNNDFYTTFAKKADEPKITLYEKADKTDVEWK